MLSIFWQHAQSKQDIGRCSKITTYLTTRYRMLSWVHKTPPTTGVITEWCPRCLRIWILSTAQMSYVYCLKLRHMNPQSNVVLQCVRDSWYYISINCSNDHMRQYNTTTVELQLIQQDFSTNISTRLWQICYNCCCMSSVQPTNWVSVCPWQRTEHQISTSVWLDKHYTNH